MPDPDSTWYPAISRVQMDDWLVAMYASFVHGDDGPVSVYALAPL